MLDIMKTEVRYVNGVELWECLKQEKDLTYVTLDYDSYMIVPDHAINKFKNGKRVV
jgi:hypothetical protein